MAQEDSIDLLFWRARRRDEVIIASPATIQRAIEKGEPITEPPRLSAEDAITKLFDERKQHALSLASSIRPCPFSATAILYLYDQIKLCMLFNLNGAAITFCGMLVEYALKYATYVKENPDTTSFDSSAWEQFEKLPLGPAITRARKAGLIDEQREQALHSFRDDLRNKHSHFNIQKITKDVFFPAKEKNIETGEGKIVELTASTPTLQILAKNRLDEDNVMKVFKFADRVVRDLSGISS
jgi:hypothetical protein